MSLKVVIDLYRYDFTIQHLGNNNTREVNTLFRIVI